MRFPLFFLLLTMLISCREEKDLQKDGFERISARNSNIDFRNNLEFDSSFNIYTYRNFYNGGGVGVGDFNLDGLDDLYFTANQGANQLYLNLGDFKFRNITTTAGVAGSRMWSTGTAIVDVNGDGLVDIYVCNSGDVRGDDKQNELFINQGFDEGGVPIFREDAQSFGLADEGHSTHAAFFDYDKDGDLDCYLLNNSYRPIGSFNLKKNERLERDSKGGDKLLRNDNGFFKDVSEEAGIYGSIIGFGLGVTVGDVNADGYEDIYVSNDFFERDYLYINQRDGTFEEKSASFLDATSSASMGADMADLNNDSYPEIFVTDMLPRSSSRYQSKTTFEDWNKYKSNIDNDYYKQFTRNSLQWNSGKSGFQEVSRMMDVAATDWSWGALIFDMNMDGYKDIFVANGIYQDLTDQDYIRYAANSATVKQMISGGRVDFQKLIAAIPSEPIANNAFINSGQSLVPFKENGNMMGLAEPGFSNGAVYTDLDNDGDYDLVVNNVNGEAWLYKNNAEAHFVKFRLKGTANNPFAIGSKVKVFQDNEIQASQLITQKGFQSSVSFDLIFGIDEASPIDSVLIEWPDLSFSVFHEVALDSLLIISYEDVEREKLRLEREEKALELEQLEFKHQELEYADFDKDQLAFFMRSTLGPAGSIGDVDADGDDELFIGGGNGQASVLLDDEKTFHFDEESRSEDVASHFFDADQDGDLDLYVCSGSSEYSSASFALFDRLYFNDGAGNFSKSSQRLPQANPIFSTCVKSCDFDGDGDLDLAVGEAYRSSAHGIPRSLFLLENDGKGKFSVFKHWEDMGMIRDLVFMDIDNDKDDDLIVVGEWMPIQILENKDGAYSQARTLDGTTGFWNTLVTGDYNGDGYLDFVAGNLGDNHPWNNSPDDLIQVHVNDFDQAGGIDVIFTKDSIPLHLKHDLENQMPSIKKRFNTYTEFKGRKLSEIFSPAIVKKSLTFDIEETSSCIFLNDKEGGFVKQDLPKYTLVAPLFAILSTDLNDDGFTDLIVGGNLSEVRPELGAMNAGNISILINNGLGQFKTISTDINGDIREILLHNDKIVFLRNNDYALKLKRSDLERFVAEQ